MGTLRLGNVLARYADRTSTLNKTITAAYHSIQKSEGLPHLYVII